MFTVKSLWKDSLMKYSNIFMNEILGIQPRKWGKIMQAAGGGILAKRASADNDVTSDTTATR